jgi:hypothetical protein
MVVVMMVVEIISSLHDRMESKIKYVCYKRKRERERESVFVISEVIVV